MSKINYLLSMACLLLIVACKNDEFTMGDRWVNPNFRTFMTDELTVTMTNVREDSVVTQGRNVILVGVYEDKDRIGKNDLKLTGLTRAESYMELTIPSSTSIDDEAIFDSIVLETWYNQYYFGDTLNKNQSLQVYQLAEELDLKGDSKYFYNTTTFNVDTLLGENNNIVVRPYFNSTFRDRGLNGEMDVQSEPLQIRLKDGLGLTLFNKMKDESEDLKNNENFVNYFKGLYIKQSDDISRSIIGLRTDTSFRVRIYYHIDQETRTEKTIDFTLNSTKQFNYIKSDRSQTALALGNFNEYNLLPSERTNDLAFMQSGDNLFIKMEFPDLNKLLGMGRLVAIEQAILYIRPISETYIEKTPLPRVLNLYESGSINEERTAIVDSKGNTQSGNLFISENPQKNTEYSYDITNFLAAQLGKTEVTRKFLLLNFPAAEMQNTVQRAVFGNMNYPDVDNRIRLEVYYTTYD